MRLKSLLALAATVLPLAAAAPQSAEAFGYNRPDQPAGWGRARKVRHWVYYPRYNNQYLTQYVTDPYAYSYEPRGYYPYYRSDYWRPADYVRQRSRVHYNVWNTRPPHFRYYQSWGYPVREWPHKDWHAYHHGRHAPWHW